MANAEQLAILRQGVAYWNIWRQENPDIQPDLCDADLHGVDLRAVDFTSTKLISADLSDVYLFHAILTGADFSKATLPNADLSEAYISRANFTKADLSEAYLFRTSLTEANFAEADLSGVYFHDAYFSRTNLTDTNFTGADLRNATLSSTIFHRTNFSNVFLGNTVFADTDLSNVIDLETIQHFGPSTIGADTLYRSGKIPEAFLRGCGVPDSLIDYLPSLIGATQPIQFYSCFISYSTKDDDFAKRLHSRMQQEHLRVWFAPHDLRGGHKLRDQIDDAIRIYDKLLLILSEASMASDWVAHEIRRAFARERAEGKRVLFPIRLCDFESLADWKLHDGPRDLAREVRDYHIPDFSHWKDHDAFEAAFAQLLKALRSDEKIR